MKNVQNYEMDLDNYIMFIRKLAWQFAKKTSLTFDELFSEAALAYCEAVLKFDPEKGNKFITFAWWCVKNHLINYCKKEIEYKKRFKHTDSNRKGVRERLSREQVFFNEPNFFEELLQITPTQPSTDVKEVMQEWPEDCRIAAKMVMEEPEKFLGETPNFSRNGCTPKQQIKNELRKLGWTHKRVQYTINQMKTAIKTLSS